MKKLITLLLVLVTLNGYSQNHDWFLEKFGTKPISVKPKINKKNNEVNSIPTQINTDILEFLVVQRINNLRIENGLDTFYYSEKCRKIASLQTEYIMKYNHKSHTQIYGDNILKNPMDRAKFVDPDISVVFEALVGRENIILNEESDLKKLAFDLVNQWINSEKHKILIMCECKSFNGEYKTYFGVSFKYNPHTMFLVGGLFEY